MGIYVDSNQFGAPVATVSYSYTVTTSVNPPSARTGPSYGHPVVRTYPPGSKVYVRCQTPGQTVRTSAVWDKLNDGSYLADYYISTPSDTTYSAPLPQCLLAYQISSSSNGYVRSGPGNEFANVGSLPPGALARVQCQATGSPYASTRVWNKPHDDNWVTDHKVATPGTTGFSPAAAAVLTTRR
ncbi:MAG: hypothetical protein ACRDQB_13195 [Thermocrispum sp.]